MVLQSIVQLPDHRQFKHEQFEGKNTAEELFIRTVFETQIAVENEVACRNFSCYYC